MLDTEIVGKRLIVYNKETGLLSEADILNGVDMFGVIIGFIAKLEDNTEITVPRDHIFRSEEEAKEFIEVTKVEDYMNEYEVMKNNIELYNSLKLAVGESSLTDARKRAIIHRLKDIFKDGE